MNLPLKRRRLRSARARARGRGRDDQVEVLDVDDEAYQRLVSAGVVNSRGEVLDERLLREVLAGDDDQVVDVDGETVGGAGDVGKPPAGFYTGELDEHGPPFGGADDPLNVGGQFAPVPIKAGDPTIRWGDSLALSFSDTISNVQSGQFLNTKLLAPVACTISVHIEQDGAVGIVDWASVTLFIGIGSSRLKRELAWANLPGPGGASVDFVLDLVAVHELYAIGAARAVTNILGGTTFLNFTVQIAPLEKN